MNRIEVRSIDNNVKWSKDLSDQEFKRVKKYQLGCENVSIFSAALRVVRSETFINFGKDFFLPTTVNQALRVQNLVGKIFATLAAIVFDVITFPIRIVNSLIALGSNKEEDGLLVYLKEQSDVDERLTTCSSVIVKLENSTMDSRSYTETTDLQGRTQRVYKNAKKTEENPHNFIDLPTGIVEYYSVRSLLI